ncbi:MAG: glycogen synthase GlgA [Nitrospinae bacterium]|nr:glycogen synthase GlgA [Nitrospinota bacterium]
MGKKRGLNVLFAASEALPYAKTGGLGDVAGALPRALAEAGCTVAVLLPLYGGIDKSKLQKTAATITVMISGRPYIGTLYKKEVSPGVTFWFLHQPELYFSRPNIYGDQNGDYPDNDARFIFFNRALSEFPAAAGFRAEVVHVNDWHLGLAPLYLKLLPEGHPLRGVPSVFSIHNLAYQGLFPRESYPLTGLPEEYFSADGVEAWGKINFMKAGILFASAVTAVSPTYAKEILGKELGFGLEKALNQRKKSLTGILNGIDTETWNPAADKHLPASYSAKKMAGKAKCRAALLEKFGLPDAPGRAVIGIVSRMVEQKGFDLITAAEKDMMKLGITLIVLGAGQPKYEDNLRALAGKYPDRVGLMIGYDEDMAHLIEAGSDIFLMPSHFEPCGLNQMYSLRYGTVPVARATGGLADTVVNWQPAKKKGNGFSFKPATPQALLGAVKKAVKTFAGKKEWDRIVQNGMAEDHSWRTSAEQYLALYRTLV